MDFQIRKRNGVFKTKGALVRRIYCSEFCEDIYIIVYQWDSLIKAMLNLNRLIEKASFSVPKMINNIMSKTCITYYNLINYRKNAIGEELPIK